ncbi:MAG: DUF1657 domain-containing protein [Acidobacteriota bacterium]
MTIAAQVKQTTASLRGAQATLEMMASLEKNPDTSRILHHNAERINEVALLMENRIRALEYEEPSYKGF